MIEAMPTFKVEAVNKNEEEVLEKEGTGTAAPKSWRTVMNRILTGMVFCVAGIIGWQVHIWLSAPEFSEMKAQFEAKGRAMDGEWISEIGKVCRNGSGTPMACEVLYFQHTPAPAMVASSRGNNQGEMERE